MVENYVREPEDNGIGSGQCLAMCKLDQLGADNFKYYDYSWSADYHFSDSDDSDGYSDSDSDDESYGTDLKQKCKFKVTTKATFYTDRGATDKIGSCKIKGKGKCKKKTKTRMVDHTENETFPDGEVRQVHRQREETYYEYENKLKKFFYKLKVGNDEEGDWKIPVKVHGSWNKSQPLTWDSELFEAQIDGFWTAKPTIKTKSEEMAPMDLLIGFMCSNVLGPEQVLYSINPPFS